MTKREKHKKFFGQITGFNLSGEIANKNYWNCSILSLHLNNFANQKLSYDKIGHQTMPD